MNTFVQWSPHAYWLLVLGWGVVDVVCVVIGGDEVVVVVVCVCVCVRLSVCVPTSSSESEDL